MKKVKVKENSKKLEQKKESKPKLRVWKQPCNHPDGINRVMFCGRGVKTHVCLSQKLLNIPQAVELAEHAVRVMARRNALRADRRARAIEKD